MGTLIQISDTHFGTEVPEVVEALLRLQARLRPDAAILSGDISQRARRAEFDAARRFVDRLNCPVVIIPGNHDVPLYNLFARVFHPYGGYRRVFGSAHDNEYRIGEMLVVTVDSTKAWRHKHGQLLESQIERAAQRLRAASTNALRAVVMHHPMGGSGAAVQKDLVRGHKEATLAWQRAGADLVLGGHIHLPYVQPVGDLNSERRLYVVQAGTAVSHRRRDRIPNSVNLIRSEPSAARRECSVERYDFNDARGEFELAATELLALGPRPPG